MYFADLQGFVAKLEDDDELVRVKAQVDPYLETAAIINLACKSTGDHRALLFENVKGSNIPLAANLFGSTKRAAMALGVADVEVLAKRLRDDLTPCSDVRSGPALAKLIGNVDANSVKSATPLCFNSYAIKQGLDALPALHSWPGDGGRYLTLGQVFTQHPDSKQQNCGMYRVQILDKQTALVRCHPGSGGGAHLQAWQAQGKAMPVAIVLGGPPALTWCAGVALPDQVSEIEFIHYLSGHQVALSKCQCSDICVPSTAEIVIEGSVGPGEEQLEGPFGNHTGYYSPPAPAAVMKVKRVLMRDAAVYPCTVVGPPPMENMYLAQAAERIMLPLLQHDYPWVVDVHMPLEGIYHRAAFVSIDVSDTATAEIARALWQSSLLRNSRLLVLLDKESDLRRNSGIYWRIVNAGPWGDSVFIEGEKMIIDARRLSRLAEVQPDQKIQAKLIARWRELGLGSLRL